MTDTQQPHDRVHVWVDQLIEAIQRRTGRDLPAAEERAGVARGYLRKARGDGRNIMLGKVLRICTEAGLEPGVLFAEVFGSVRERVELLSAGRDQVTPSVLVTLEQRLNTETDALVSPPLTNSWLDMLDDLRYNDPERALSTVEQAISFLPREELPRALGIWASAARLLVRLDEALPVCHEGLRLAREWKQPLDEADLLRRLAYLVSSHTGDYAAALEISGQAMALYGRHGELPKVGQVVIDQAIFLGNLDRLDEGRRAFHIALSLIADDDRRHHLGALQGLAVIARMDGRHTEALSHAEKAFELEGLSRFEMGQLSGFLAALLSDLGRLAEATEHAANAVERLAPVAPVNAALVLCDHTKALLAAGHLEEARQALTAGCMLLEPLADNVIASAALRDLLCAESDGRHLTVTLVEIIRAQIETGRRGKPRRPRHLVTLPGR